MSDEETISSKAALRAKVLTRRDALTRDQRGSAALALVDRGLPVSTWPSCIVSGFSPIQSEIDPMPLMRRLAAQGVQLALPVIIGRCRPLEFHAWSFGERLTRGPLGILQPDIWSNEVLPDIVLVPLVAFDRLGHRLGYGGGYYDRTLRRLRGLKPIVTIGIAFTVQEVERLSTSIHDETLDFVMTEERTLGLPPR